MDLLKYQDPAAYKAALASGQVFANVDPRRLNQASIQAAGARSTDLLNQKIGEFGLERDQYGFDRRKTTDANQDAAAPFLVGAYSAGRQGADAFSQYIAAHPELSKLNYADTGMLASGALDAESKGVNIDTGRLGMVQTRQNIDQSGTRFGWETQDRAVADEADKVWATLQQNGFDGESQMTMLNGMKNLSPKVYNAIASRIGGMGGGGSPAANMIANAVGGGGSGASALGMTYGGGALPDSIQTVGQLVANKGNLVRSLGASPVGVYQINADTWADFAPKVLGKDWANASVRDFATQDAIGKKIFESTGGDPGKLMKRWASLDAATAKSIAGKPWEVARQVIAAGESKADPRALALGLTATQQGTRNMRMERDANSLMPDYAKAATDKRDAATLAGEEAGKGAFAGLNAAQLNEQIRLVQAEGRKQKITISPAVAATIARNSTNSSAWSRFFSGYGSNDAKGQYIDSDAVKRYVTEVKGGAVDNAVQAEANTQQAEAGQAQAKGAYDAAYARYQAAAAFQRRGGNVDLAPLEGAVNRAAAMLQAATNGIGTNAALVRFNAAPAPEPVAYSRRAGAGPLKVAPAPMSKRDIWMNALAGVGN
jgi:hypothetical protein